MRPAAPTILAMDTLAWIVIGGALGWIGYSRFGLNEERGRTLSIILGAVGAVIGAGTIAPMLVTVPASGLSFAGMLFAGATAAGALALGNMVSHRWGI
jgi:uncharacterized membrane protein YeaQ/YmgE (transglycosylase-associated protein family)